MLFDPIYEPLAWTGKPEQAIVGSQPLENPRMNMADGGCGKPAPPSRPRRVWGDKHRSELSSRKETPPTRDLQFVALSRPPTSTSGDFRSGLVHSPSQSPVSVGDIQKFPMVFPPYLRPIKILDIEQQRANVGAEVNKRIFTSPVPITSCPSRRSVI